MVDPTPADTDPAVYALLVKRWRAMTIAERMQLTDQLCRDVERLAIAGIRFDHPEYDDRAVIRELMRRRYGKALADAAYGDDATHREDG